MFVSSCFRKVKRKESYGVYEQGMCEQTPLTLLFIPEAVGNMTRFYTVRC